MKIYTIAYSNIRILAMLIFFIFFKFNVKDYHVFVLLHTFNIDLWLVFYFII